jgi:hypothetical protein
VFLRINFNFENIIVRDSLQQFESIRDVDTGDDLFLGTLVLFKIVSRQKYIDERGSRRVESDDIHTLRPEVDVHIIEYIF